MRIREGENTDWENYFKETMEKGFWKYVIDHWMYNLPFHISIEYFFPPPRTVLEVGCGSALSGIYLSHRGYDVTCMDNNEKVLNIAHESCRRLEGKIKLELGDMFNLDTSKKYDIIFSSGVIEHFPKEKAFEALQIQAKMINDALFIAVPSKYTLKPENFGDHVVYEPLELRRIMKKLRLKVISQFGWGDIDKLKLLRNFIIPRGTWDYFFAWKYSASICVIGGKVK
jgi:SAM-dependent methyltransferase